MRLALLLALLLPAPALAQEGDSAGPRDPGRTPVLVGVAATVVPIAVGATVLAATDNDALGFYTMYGGAILGPSIGNWSAGLVGRGFSGLLIRTGIAAAAVMGPFVVCPGLDECSDAAQAGALAVFVVGNAALLAHAAWDLGTLPKRARSRAASVSVAPTWDPVARGPGLRLRVGF
jgi:hypothetical protein